MPATAKQLLCLHHDPWLQKQLHLKRYCNKYLKRTQLLLIQVLQQLAEMMKERSEW